MASTTNVLFFLVLIINSFALLNAGHDIIFPPASFDIRSCNFNKIYQFGDSISDTGNLILESPAGAHSPCNRLPYGETFFKKVTGRCSDGLLMIDYIAWASGVSFLNPYKIVNASFENGANFAVAGSTALPTETLALKNIASPVTNSSLDVQLGWMSTHFASLYNNDTDCAEKLKNSLFMVGEIGGNDYNYAFFQGKTIEEVKTMVPDVVQVITNATRKVIQLGARRIVVPGNFPIGCMPIYLTGFQTNNSAAYDIHHCITELNHLAKYHNYQLQKEIVELEHEYHNTTIVYADYYHAFRWLLKHAPHLGFDATSLQKACCGTGGEYNFNRMQLCGSPNVSTCLNPDQHITWDGIHLTSKANEVMASWLIKKNLPKLKCRP